MKLKYILIILLSILSLTAFAQQQKVAVYVTGQETGTNQVLGDQLVAAFAKSSKYFAIERTESFLAELGKEQNYQRTGAVSDNDIARLGVQFGVQLVCVVKVTEAFGKKYVSARLIEVEKAQVINSANATSELNSMDELIRVCNELKGQLFGDYSENSKVPQGYVDLGLPSGTLWQKSSTRTEVFYENASALSTQANAKIPTYEQFQELIDECTWTKIPKGQDNIVEVKGKNGNVIFLYKTNGCCTGIFWTSTNEVLTEDRHWVLEVTTYEPSSHRFYSRSDLRNGTLDRGVGFIFVKDPE